MQQTTRSVGILLLISFLLWRPHHAVGDDQAKSVAPLRAMSRQDAFLGGARVALVGSPTLPASLPPALTEGARRERAIEQRVASVLQKLGKTLILERTRGATEEGIYKTAAPAVVVVVTNEGFGSGAIIDGEGHVITNGHVVAAYPHVVVVFKPKDGTDLRKELAFRATVEKVDDVTDLALLKIHTPPKVIVSLPLEDVSTLAVGQDVYAIGHPEGESWTFTKGIISQIRANYAWSTTTGPPHRAKVIQTQTPVNPGNSGGPLLDKNGKLIGINAFRRQGEGLNYAVGVDVIQAFLKNPTPHPPAVVAGEPRCTETYVTKGHVKTDILGYYVTSTAPPPDLWLISRDSRRSVAYAAGAGLVLGQINTVIKSQDPQWQHMEYYIDSHCSGTVDLIGYQRKGSGVIDSYRLPEKPLRLVTLAKELDSALKRRDIPYPKLHVCQ